MTDPIYTTADARALVRDAVVLLDNVVDTDAPALLPDTLRIVLADGAEVLVRVTVFQPSPGMSRADCVAAATAAGWLIQPEEDGDFDEGVDTASAAPGSYTFGDWKRDLLPPPGAVYQWRMGSVGEPSAGLFLQNRDTPMCDGTQYRIATLTDDGALAFGNGIDWSEVQQRAALARGWCLKALGDSGAVTIAADAEVRDVHAGDDNAAQWHVSSNAESVCHPDPAYQELCQHALRVVEQTAAEQEG